MKWKNRGHELEALGEKFRIHTWKKFIYMAPG